jgi:antitoxin FitA
MASITIRNLDDHIKAKLRVQAAQHGLSMEQEVREILRASLEAPTKEHGTFLQRIRSRFAGYEIDELPIPPREDYPNPPDFSEFDVKER